MEKKFDELGLTGALPSSLPVSLGILDLILGGTRDINRIGRIFGADPALAARLLKLANTTHGTNKNHVDGIRAALERVGWDAAEVLALGFTLTTDDRCPSTSGFDYEQYWSESHLTALLCDALARAVGWEGDQRAYTLGLLADLGTLALASVHANRYAVQIAPQSGGWCRDRSTMENQVLGIDHCEVAFALFEDAGLSPALQRAVLVHEHIERFPGETDEVQTLAALLLASKSAAAVMEWEEGQPLQALRSATRSFHKCVKELGLPMEKAREVCARAAARWGRHREDLGATLEPLGSLDQVSDLGTLDEEEPCDELSLDPPTPLLHNPQWEARSTAAADISWEDSARVLLIDDDPITLKVVGAQLRKFGHEVLVAKNGREGLEVALTQDPQILITDWNMPGITGIELCKLLRTTDMGRRLYILMLTARDDDDQVIQALEAGADDFLVKPSNPRILLARVQAGRRTVHTRERTEAMELLRLRQVAELGILARKLESDALTDSLTRLPNRRYAIQRLEQEWQATSRSDQALSVILIDIDHFKQVNDTHGHGGGDAILREVAQRMRRAARASDVLCRFGGEEFLLITPGCNAQEARRCAERVRLAVAKTPIRYAGVDCPVTISLGIAERNPDTESVDELLQVSDRAMYAAKASGRNRCA